MSTQPPSDPAAETISVERESPEAVFAVLGNESRLAILRALGEAEGAVSFSELHDRIDLRDSGQFNYHLGKLLDRFVRKADDGYSLTLAGDQLVGALLAGTYTATAVTDEPIELPEACPECRGSIAVTYADELVEMACLECGGWYNEFTFPPGVLDQVEVGDLPRVFDRWLLTVLERTHAGFCHNCAGRVEGALTLDEAHPHGVTATHACERCGQDASCSAAMPVLFHPAGTSFLYDHGVDRRETPTWELAAAVDTTVRVTATDPPAAEVTLVGGEATLTATVGADLTVSQIERQPG